MGVITPGDVLNSLEEFEYAPPAPDREGDTVPRDRAPRQPHRIPNAVTQHGRAGSCMINWTSIWHTRPPNFTDQPRDVIWQVFRGKTT